MKATGLKGSSYLSISICITMLCLTPSSAKALTLKFWDINGSTLGAGSSAPSGTWSVEAGALWNEDDTGGGAKGGTAAWTPGQIAVFAAGNDATGSYTISVSGTQQVADIHVDLGDVTFQGGSLRLVDKDGNGANRLLSVGHKTDSCVARYNTVLTGCTNLIRYKRGTLILGATNTFSGPFTIEGGVVRLGAPNVLPSTTPLILKNNDTTRGDFNPIWQNTPAVFATGGFNQTLGTLQMAGADPGVQRKIDFGNGASALVFADSDAQDWNGIPLDIVNFTTGVDSFRIGTDGTGFDTQLALIRFSDLDNAPAKIDSNGFITPNLPAFISIKRTGPTNIELVWTTIQGRFYRVQYKTSLSDPTWQDIEPDIFANGSTTTMTDFSATTEQRYYRVQLL